MAHYDLNSKRENDRWINSTMWKIVLFLNFCSVVLPNLLIWSAKGAFALLNYFFPK